MSSELGLTYEHRLAFWCGAAAVTVGTVAQLPMYFDAAEMNYRLRGMPFDAQMTFGMALIFVGIGLTFYGLFPAASGKDARVESRIEVKALDDAPITRAHLGLILVMAAAITIDVMKPTTLAFVAPGAAAEYGLRSPLNPNSTGWPIALYPLAGISGTVVGSFVWGWMGDRIGRRASILIAAVLFIATSTCGVMPAYWLNLVMCFAMGLGVGGMLPIIFSLVSETIPARHRGWIVVLIGGDVAGAYIIMSWLAATIGAPDRYGWRMLWLIGIPISIILVLLNRWIPESPRFLLHQGRDLEARAVMQRYGATVVEVRAPGGPAAEREPSNFGQLFRPPFSGLTAVLVALAVGIGVVQYGFQQWIPSNLQRLGYEEVDASKILRDSALIGFPLNFPIALLYGFWSSRKTIILMATLTASALAGFVLAGENLASGGLLLKVLLVVPIWGISSLTAVTAAYASEIYPTRIRARGTGLAAAGTKIGGVLVLAAVAAAVATPSISLTALLGAIPLAVAVVLMAVFGVETRRKGLEQIAAEELSRRSTGVHLRYRPGVTGLLGAETEVSTNPAPAAPAPPGRRVISSIGIALVLATALVGSNMFGISDRLFGSAVPPPTEAAASRSAGTEAATSPDRTLLRSQPWWQEVTVLEGSGSVTAKAFSIGDSSLQWRMRWTCETGRLVVRTPARPKPLVDAACPATGDAFATKPGAVAAKVTADGPWKLLIEQQVDVPLVEPPLATMTDPATSIAAEGTFFNIDQKATGAVTIYRQPDGSHALRLNDFFVTPNADLEVRLGKGEAPRTTEEFLSGLGESALVTKLDVTTGSLNFVIPAGIDPGRFRSVVIWCEAVRSAYASAALDS